MQILLEINNPNDLQLLLQYVKLLSSAKVVETNGKRMPVETQKSFFEKYYGSVKSKMTVEEIDIALKKLREE